MNQTIDKKTVEGLGQIPGETRGLNIKSDGEYILKNKGKEGLAKLEKEMERLGYPVKYLKMKNMGFYPVSWRVASLIALKNVFDFNDKDIYEMGRSHARIPLVIKIFLKYFYSIQRIMKKAQEMWQEYYTIGEISFSELNEKEKYAVVQIKGVDFHPLWCLATAGYFASTASLVFGEKNTSCREVKCPFKGGQAHVHEFLIKW